MDYRKHYNLLIESRRLIPRIKQKDKPGEYESHHIVPRSLGGNDTKSNKILLTPREHYIAHWLLYKMCSGTDKVKMAYAWFKMCSNNPSQKRVFSSRQYHNAKESMRNTCIGENHPNYGVNPFTDEQIDRMRSARLGNGNGMYGKTPWNKGILGNTHTSETKQKMSESHRGKPKTTEHRSNLSKSLKGKPKSDEHREKLRQAYTYRQKSEEELKRLSERKKGEIQPVLVCPHCGKSGGFAMKRWHFERCRSIK